MPQLFSLKLSNSSLILELMESGNAKAMICDSQCLENFQDSPVPVYPVAIPKNISNFRRVKLPPVQTKGGPEEILMVFHTSGSTSGSPKLVPYTRRWLGCAIEKSAAVCKPAKMGYFDVTTWLGSACHVGQTSSKSPHNFSWNTSNRSFVASVLRLHVPRRLHNLAFTACFHLYRITVDDNLLWPQSSYAICYIFVRSSQKCRKGPWAIVEPPSLR